MTTTAIATATTTSDIPFTAPTSVVDADGKTIVLRPYQILCINSINAQDGGSHLICLPTASGKTIIFTNIIRRGRTLILAGSNDIINETAKYYRTICSVGVEANTHYSNGEDVIIASIQTIINRLDAFDPNEFDTIIVDEAHHAVAPNWNAVIKYFNCRLLLGFTATPNRFDGVGLKSVFGNILFEKGLLEMIEQGYLCNINAKRINIGCDLRNVGVNFGDFNERGLQKAMRGTSKAIAQIYRKYAIGSTLIFAVSIKEAIEISQRIPGSQVVTGTTPQKKREQIIDDFREGKFSCLINCKALTEGVNIKRIRTIIIARPTCSNTEYIQMVGRGLRLCEGKPELLLIDCVGTTDKCNLQTAPSLIGVDMSEISENRRAKVQGNLFTLAKKAVLAKNDLKYVISHMDDIDLWAKGTAYNTHGVDYRVMPNGNLLCHTLHRDFVITAPNILGRVTYNGQEFTIQQALDAVFSDLRTLDKRNRALWDLSQGDWRHKCMTERQRTQLNYFAKLFNEDISCYMNCDREAASKIITFFKYREEAEKEIRQIESGKAPIMVNSDAE